MSNRFEKQITGIFPSKEGNMCFLADGFDFTIMDNSIEPLRFVEIEPRDGFLRGKTRDGYDIGMYAGKEKAHIFGNCRYETGAYIVSLKQKDGDISYYNGIEFVGGTLNKLYKPYMFRIQGIEPEEKETINFSITQDDVTIQFEIGYSVILDRTQKGQRNEETVYCRLSFSCAQNLESFFKHFVAVKELIAFMTFRQNVGFEDIFLLSQPKTINGYQFTNHLAVVHIQYENALTEKGSFSCIGFEDIKSSLPTFLMLLYNNKERKPLYSSGYIPKDDLDVYRMSNSKIREICSAIECELSHVQVCDEEVDSNLRELVDSVKRIIKEHRESERKLPDKAYDTINGSISNWSIPASERIIALYQMHWQDVVNLRPIHFPMTDSTIEDFIKYRNDITHGKYRVLDENIARTGFARIGLIYCCVLTRIGVDSQTIHKISNIPELLKS